MVEAAITTERRYITPRPRVTVGRTVEVKVGCGSLYVTINKDEHGIAEVFVKLGKSGGCSASQTEALGKMISLALDRYLKGEFYKVRAGAEMSVPLNEFFDVSGNSAGKEEGNGTGIDIGKGNGNGTGKEAGNDAGNTGDIPVPVPAIPVSVHGNGNGNGNGNGSKVAAKMEGSPYSCPDCGSIMQPREGCLICDSCGYSKCG